LKGNPISKSRVPLFDLSEVEIGPLVHHGSSGAELCLVQLANQQTIVRKYSTKNPLKLLEQFNWLESNNHLKLFPHVNNPVRAQGFFSYDMPYYSKHQSLHYILNSRETLSEDLVSSFFQSLHNKFHHYNSDHFGTSAYEYYLNEKVLKKVQACQLTLENHSELWDSEFISVNGKSYNNFKKIWSRLHEQSTRQLIRSFNNGAIESIHGDLTAENILISNENAIFLDPNQENYISTIGVEVSKLFQSLHSNYEHLGNCHFEFDRSSLNYNFILSPRRKRTCEAILNRLIKDFSLSHEEVIFHEAIHFARMLPYKVGNAQRFPIYYARMIELFNMVLW
jgi:hypothetical protein